MGDQISANTGKVSAGFLNIFFGNGDRNIFLLHNAVCARDLVKQHLIVFPAVHIAGIAPHRH